MWHLKKIPKIAYFYWGNSKLPFLRYLTIKSFSIFNHSWNLQLYVPIKKDSYASKFAVKRFVPFTGIDYFDELKNIKNLELITFDFNDIGVSNDIWEVHKSDFLRWHLLSKYGGLWSDIDILYYDSINNLNLNTADNSDTDMIQCVKRYGLRRIPINSIGFLLSSTNNSYYKKVFEKAKEIHHPDDFQCIGSKLLNKYKLNIDEFNVKNLDMNAIYPLDFRKKNYNKIFEESIRVNNGIGLHWYGAGMLSKKYENEINKSNYKNYNNTLGLIMKKIEL